MAQVIFTKTAEKSFLKLPTNAKKKIVNAIEKLTVNPLLGEKLKGEFEGQCKLYAWPYRVIYIFSAGGNIVTVVEVEHRQGAYK